MKIIDAVDRQYVVIRAHLTFICLWVLSRAYAQLIFRLGLSLGVCPLVMFAIDSSSVSPLYSFSYVDFGFLSCIGNDHLGWFY